MMRAQQWKNLIPWKDVKPGEGAELDSGDLVVRIDPACSLADGLRQDEANLLMSLTNQTSTYMGVVVRTDATNFSKDSAWPGSLMIIGPDMMVKHVVWHGYRVPLWS